jgi:hypothetical protein
LQAFAFFDDFRKYTNSKKAGWLMNRGGFLEGLQDFIDLAGSR